MKEIATTDISRYIASATFIALLISTIIIFFPHWTEHHSLFSLSWSEGIVKLALAAAMLIVAIAGSPRQILLRRTLGVLAVLILTYATFSAYTSQLALGDMVLLFSGALIATLQSLDVHMPATEVDGFTVLQGTKANS